MKDKIELNDACSLFAKDPYHNNSVSFYSNVSSSSSFSFGYALPNKIAKIVYISLIKELKFN